MSRALSLPIPLPAILPRLPRLRVACVATVRAYAAAATKTASVAHTKGPVEGRPAWAKGLPTLGHILDAQVSRKRTHRDCLRVCHQDERMTYAETLEMVNAVGNGLHDNRVLPGKRLGMLVASDVEAVCTLFGAAKAGAIASWINPLVGVQAARNGFKAVNPRGFIMTPTVMDAEQEYGSVNFLYDMVPEIESLQQGEVLRSKHFPDLKTVCHTVKEELQGVSSIYDVLLFDPMPDPLPELVKKLSADSLGTEYLGESGERTQFTQNQLLDAGFNWSSAMGLQDDRVCMALDIVTPAAQSTILACAASDSLSIVASSVFNADTLLREAGVEKASVIVTTPKRAAAALESSGISREDLSSLHTVVLVSSPGDEADASLVKKVQNGFEVANVMVGFAAPGCAPFLLSLADPSAPGAVGRAVPNVEIKIADASGKSVAIGETGNLLSKGPHNGMVPADGWVQSGAQARMDGEGNVFLA